MGGTDNTGIDELGLEQQSGGLEPVRSPLLSTSMVGNGPQCPEGERRRVEAASLWRSTGIAAPGSDTSVRKDLTTCLLTGPSAQFVYWLITASISRSTHVDRARRVNQSSVGRSSESEGTPSSRCPALRGSLWRVPRWSFPERRRAAAAHRSGRAAASTRVASAFRGRRSCREASTVGWHFHPASCSPLGWSFMFGPRVRTRPTVRVACRFLA